MEIIKSTLTQTSFQFRKELLHLHRWSYPASSSFPLHSFQNAPNTPKASQRAFFGLRFGPRGQDAKFYPCQGRVGEGSDWGVCLEGLQHTWLGDLRHGGSEGRCQCGGNSVAYCMVFFDPACHDLRIWAANVVLVNDPGIGCIYVISAMRSSASPISYNAHVGREDHGDCIVCGHVCALFQASLDAGWLVKRWQSWWKLCCRWLD